MDFFHIILAILPFFVFCLLLIFRHKTSLLRISLVTLIITVFIAFIFWQSSASIISFSVSQGLFIALDILFIIFGAILFLEILKKNKITESLAIHLNNFSPDLRIQVIILAWFFEGFLEGIAGFGTPSIIVAPLLIALGLSPLNAVIISLLGNSTSVPFGAVGTPIRVGFAGININLVSIGSSAATYNFVGLLVPIFMLWVLLSSNPRRLILFKQGLPFAIWSGIAFVLPSFLISLFGIEFPSIIGSIVGIFLVVMTSRFGIFVPKEIYHNLSTTIKNSNILNLKKTVFPYALFIILLIFAKIFLSNIKISIPFFSYSFNLFNPGFILLITGIIVALYSKINFKNFSSTAKLAASKSIEPFLVVAAMSAVVQIMNNSANSELNLVSITQTISEIFSTKLLPILSPFIGALGSFITGSATVSNIMFGPSIYSSSLSLGFNSTKILSLLLVGAGAGNMIAIADILAAKTVAGDKDSLRKIIFSLLPYCLIYLILIALFGLLSG
ncbi:MAG TPA: L-lactate permease [Candidatus Woesebacteria bacterium]|nr:L-lactate permease [Candidatus Woesebacteria bacterium]